MSKENNKIYFSNSPYTNGHKVVDFVWNARLDEDFKLRFDLHLESDQYDEEDEYTDVIEDIDDISVETTEKSLWINYDHCIISSSFWENKGIAINTEKSKLDFKDLNNTTFLLDPLPVNLSQEESEYAFGISMLGKDIIADNELTFIDTEEFGVFDIKWKAKVANVYLGESSFDYDFYTYMKNIRFGGIKIDNALDIMEVEKFLKANLANYEEFELLKNDENHLENYILKLKAR